MQKQLLTLNWVVKAQVVTRAWPSVRSSAIATAAAASRAVSPDMPAQLSSCVHYRSVHGPVDVLHQLQQYNGAACTLGCHPLGAIIWGVQPC
jgi:hypothetical protein